MNTSYVNIWNISNYFIKIKMKTKKPKNKLKAIEEYAIEEYTIEELSMLGLSDFTRLVERYYKINGMRFRESQALSYIQTLFLKFNPEAEQILADKITKNILDKITKNKNEI